MHLCCAYTRNHPQRTHRLLVPLPPVVAPALAPAAAVPPPPPPPPAVDTGVTLPDLRRNMKVQVWWLGDWWAARIAHLSVPTSTVTVRFLGDRFGTPGIQPRHIKIDG